jgi:hypothetical protein
MMPTTVEVWAEPITSVHHAVASGGASLPSRPLIVELAQLPTPLALISFCKARICCASDLRSDVDELTTDSDFTNLGYFAAKRIATAAGRSRLPRRYRPTAERCGSQAIETSENRRSHHVRQLPEAALSEPKTTDAGIDGEDGSPPGSR